MTKPILAHLFILGVFITNTFAQTCRIQIKDNLEFLKKNYGEELAMFASLEFEINAITLKCTDTNIINITPNSNGFDENGYPSQGWDYDERGNKKKEKK
ncbi:MAG: hypothetical protein R2852_03000 [Bacteroidia bacterium]